MTVAILQSYCQTRIDWCITCEYAPTERSLLELLTPIQTVSELQKTDIVLGNLVDQMSCSTKLTKGKLVMVFVVEHIHERRQERMQVLHDKRN